MKQELETTDLQANLDKVDELEEASVLGGSDGGEAWRPTRVIEDDARAYRYDRCSVNIDGRWLTICQWPNTFTLLVNVMDMTIGR